MVDKHAGSDLVKQGKSYSKLESNSVINSSLKSADDKNEKAIFKVENHFVDDYQHYPPPD
jgi:hypothetical protein